MVVIDSEYQKYQCFGESLDVNTVTSNILWLQVCFLEKYMGGMTVIENAVKNKIFSMMSGGEALEGNYLWHAIKRQF